MKRHLCGFLAVLLSTVAFSVLLAGCSSPTAQKAGQGDAPPPDRGKEGAVQKGQQLKISPD